jgi:transposase
MHHAVRPVETPRVVGVDDFAWTKRRRYGTILVDLETHRLLALLADCEVETVAAWFRQHPSVQIVTRDRSSSFADAIRRGAPTRFTLPIGSIYI